MLINRKLPKILIQTKAFDKDLIEAKKQKALSLLKMLDNTTVHYFVNTGTVKNEAYQTKGTINILTKQGELIDLASASDNYNIMALTEAVTKYYLCYLS
jgi:hypothetical protein